MNTTINIDGKPVSVSTSKEADVILSSRELPLTVEMDLFFSCPLSKKVRFIVDDEPEDMAVHINEKLAVRFRPVIYRDCSKQEAGHWVMTDFPIVKRSSYVPKWLDIDFRFGHWFGEFGYLN